jgi:uncharacterized protein
VHGFIRLEGRECDVVDTRVFQRLRRIRQLAMAHLVYPGAVHSRLEHSLGVAHVAGRLCDRLGIDREATRLIRLAALLHDIGHGPFSHPSEEVLRELATEEGRVEQGETHKVHELITREIIRSDPDVRSLISDREREDIIKLLDTGWGDPLHKDVVSGPLDADKQDYLLRDSHHCGVRYGIYDISRLHDVLCRVNDEPGDCLAIQEDGVNTLEQFVLARYYLTTQVISHKVRRITDAMLVRGLSLGVKDDGIDFLHDLYTFRPGVEFVEEYVQWNDERLVSRLLEPEHADTWAGRFMRRLADRRLLKVVFNRPVTDFPELVTDAERSNQVAPDIEAEVGELLGVDRREVIFRVYRSPPTRKSEGAVLVSGRGDRLEPFESRSLIFRSIDQSLKDEYLECFAPLDDRDSQEKRRVRSDVGAVIERRLGALAAQTNTSGGDDAT